MSSNFSFFLIIIPPPPRSTLFPYTTLFRSRENGPYGSWTTFQYGDNGKITATTSGMKDVTYDDYLNDPDNTPVRSEEHTSELQSHSDLVCRLLLEKKKKTKKKDIQH